MLYYSRLCCQRAAERVFTLLLVDDVKLVESRFLVTGL